MTDLFIHLLNMSITAGWLVLAIALLRPVLKKAPRAIVCALWALVAVRLLLPFSIESVLSLIPSAETVPPDIIYAQEPAIQTGIPSFNAAINPIITEAFAPQGLVSINPIQVFLLIASWVWVLGIVGMLVYALVSYLRIRKKVSAAVCQSHNIYICDYVDSPFILGISRPRIYLPSTLSEEAVEAVIAHEEAHLARKDHWWKPLGYLLLAVYWFNPLMWLAYILLCRDIELACDEKVIKTMSGPEKQAYSTALLGCSVRRSRIAACPLAFGEVGVKARIQSVLSYKKPAFWLILVAVIASIAVAVCFLTDPKDTAGEQEDPPSFRATVAEVNGTVLLVEPEDKSLPGKICVIVDKLKSREFKVGDTVVVVYDGTIAETYPAQILNPYQVLAHTESSGPPAANSYGSYYVGKLLAQDVSLSFEPQRGDARISLHAGYLQYISLTGDVRYNGDTFISSTFTRQEFENELSRDLFNHPFLPAVLGSNIQSLLEAYNPTNIIVHQYYRPESSAHSSWESFTVFYFDGTPTWFFDGSRLYELEYTISDTPYKVVSRDRSIQAIAFPDNVLLQDIEPYLYELELTLAPDIMTPFDVLVSGQPQYGWYSIYDAETFESLEFTRPSGVEPQTFLLQNAQYGKSYIVSMKTGEQTLYWKIKLPEEDDWGITMTAQDVTPTSMLLSITHDDGSCVKQLPITTSLVDFQLERLTVGWHPVASELEPVETLNNRQDLSFSEVCFLVDWELQYGVLEPGTYRICKNIYQGDESQTFYAEFQIP